MEVVRPYDRNKKATFSFPEIGMDYIPANKTVLVQFKKFSLVGDSESCGNDTLQFFYYGETIDGYFSKQSIDFCGKRSGEIYRIDFGELGGFGRITAHADLASKRAQRFVIKFKVVNPGNVGNLTPDLPLVSEDEDLPPSSTAQPPSPTAGPPSPTAEPPSPPSGAFECGKPVSNRIVGGSEADPFSIPWQVGLIFNQDVFFSMKPNCGGTLISPRHVMTAAHCTRGKTLEIIYESLYKLLQNMWHVVSF